MTLLHFAFWVFAILRSRRNRCFLIHFSIWRITSWMGSNPLLGAHAGGRAPRVVASVTTRAQSHYFWPPSLGRGVQMSFSLRVAHSVPEPAGRSLGSAECPASQVLPTLASVQCCALGNVLCVPLLGFYSQAGLCPWPCVDCYWYTVWTPSTNPFLLSFSCLEIAPCGPKFSGN